MVEIRVDCARLAAERRSAADSDHVVVEVICPARKASWQIVSAQTVTKRTWLKIVELSSFGAPPSPSHTLASHMNRLSTTSPAFSTYACMSSRAEPLMGRPQSCPCIMPRYFHDLRSPVPARRRPGHVNHLRRPRG